MEVGAVGVPGPPASMERALELASVIILHQDLMADHAREKALKNGPVKKENSYGLQNQVSSLFKCVTAIKIKCSANIWGISETQLMK